ncbi:hypothetical protein GY12_28275 [Micrococcus luteus]|nr:hypothetical protein GY12_28275 [Micrococcus luteus]
MRPGSAGTGVFMMVDVLELGRRDQPDLAVHTTMVEPVDVLRDRDLQSRCVRGPLFRISSALNSELNASARALS